MAEIDEELSDPAIGTDLAKLRKLTDEQADKNGRLAVLMEEWEKLSEEVEG